MIESWVMDQENKKLDILRKRKMGLNLIFIFIILLILLYRKLLTACKTNSLQIFILG